MDVADLMVCIRNIMFILCLSDRNKRMEHISLEQFLQHIVYNKQQNHEKIIFIYTGIHTHGRAFMLLPYKQGFRGRQCRERFHNQSRLRKSPIKLHITMIVCLKKKAVLSQGGPFF